MAKKILKIKNYLLKFIQIQLILTVASLPILIYWGLPVSKTTFIANLIFTPVLGLFLILSSLIFFTEILNINNYFFINLLEKLTDHWVNILNLGKKSWLLCFSKQNILILLIIFFLIFIILTHKKINNIYKRIFCLTILLFFSITFFKLQNYFFKTEKFLILGSKNSYFAIKQDLDNKIFILDNNFLARKKSLENFLYYDLRPFFIKNFGTLNIEGFVFKTKKQTLKTGYIIKNLQDFFNINNSWLIFSLQAESPIKLSIK